MDMDTPNPKDPSQDSDPGLDEQDPRFPSGPWFGFYRQGGVQSRQRFALHFRNGRIRGEGKDPVAPFAVSGSYSNQTGSVFLTKSYKDYCVHYAGRAEGDGIPGSWTIEFFGGIVCDAGEFHIWPDELAMEELRKLQKEEPVPA
ncbi:MAG: hypothetical protein NTV94_12915 [Planctomycetota bacterium]|nr:hypothetical protein [Planctomycetota bacterium]